VDSWPRGKTAIAKRFKALRRRSLLSQSRLGEILGLCRQSVSEIECRRVLLHPSTWRRFQGLEAKHDRAQVVRLPRHWR